ncbi:hypothetical protein [Serratia oryzae]|uniref:hypothetical protein n=1 Tax=Serratia oryzae TaxID=2034155 RepID=UPI0012E2F667|nr:hypothetical protein [Serratia oryzae]
MKEFSNSQANFMSLVQKKGVMFLLIARAALVGAGCSGKKKPDKLSARLHFCGAALTVNGANRQTVYGNRRRRSEQSRK